MTTKRAAMCRRRIAYRKGLDVYVQSDPHGYDAGTKIKGKKRHVLVDTHGLLMQATVHSADVQDRNGGVMSMASLFESFPFLLKLYADDGYQGAKFQDGASLSLRAGQRRS